MTSTPGWCSSGNSTPQSTISSLPGVLEDGHVAADLAQAAERDDAQAAVGERGRGTELGVRVAHARNATARRGQPGRERAGPWPGRRIRRLGCPVVRVVTIREPGGPEVLFVTDAEDPVAGPGEVLLDVRGRGGTAPTCCSGRGTTRPRPGPPSWPGLECAGTVAEVGPDVEGWSPGDAACALLAGGGYAEKVAVPAAQLLPVPAGLDLVGAAALPEVACTVWSNLFMVAALQPGEVLLVHGGGSGIGTMAIQLGRQAGARVAVTAGSAAKLERCRELGAQVLVNYREEDFVAAVRGATDGHGADVVLDPIGAKYLARNVDVLAADGRLVVIGLQGGSRAELDLSALLAKRAALVATSLRARPAAEKAAIVASVRQYVWPLVDGARCGQSCTRRSRWSGRPTPTG